MKRCPQCNRVETDEALKYCRVDGATLVVDASAISSEAAAAPLDASEVHTSILPHHTNANVDRATAPTTVLSGQPVGSPTNNPDKRTRSKAVVVVGSLAGVAIVVAIVLGGYFYFSRQSKTTIDSIAVLPFVNQNRDPDTEYLSDGLTESIINSLAELPGLRVSPRSSVFQYKGKDIDPLKAARDLGVRAVLTGRVMQHGDNLTIGAELVDVRDNKQLWGEDYERKLSDLLAVKQDISGAISERLRTKLSGEEQKQLTRRDTRNPEAYQLYLKGRYFWGKFTEDGTKKSIEYYRQAIEIDPNYALAFAGLCSAYNIQGASGLVTPREVIPKANAAAEKAIALDDTLSEAHSCVGSNKLYFDWDWLTAERELKRAIELNPNAADAHDLYGGYLQATGRLDQAIAEYQRARELAPLSPQYTTDLAYGLYANRQFDQSLDAYRKGAELDPNFPVVPFLPGQIYERKGAYQEAIAECQKTIASRGREPAAVSALGYAEAMSGAKSEAQKIANELVARWQQHYFPPFLIALVYTALDDKDQAFAWLNKAFAERDSQLTWVNTERQLDSLHSDPRFADLLRRMGLPQ
jgi:TolB-like protein/Flp pilus assembly protein TadD